MKTMASMGSATLALASSIAAKSALTLLVSAYAYGRMPAVEVAAFFQLIFFQSIVITFVSASGFFTAIASDRDATADRRRTNSYLWMSSVAVVALGIFRNFNDLDVSLLMYLLICVGGIATGLSSPLSGTVARDQGYWAAFGPSVLTSGLGAAMLVLPGIPDSVRPYIAWSVPQVAYYVYLVLSGLSDAGRRAPAAIVQAPAGATSFVHVISFGLLNTLTLAVIFHLRDEWAADAPATTVAACFLLLRVGDTVLQVITMLAAPIVKSAAADLRVVRQGSVVCLAISGAGLLALGAVSTQYLPALAFAILAQFALEMIRMPASLAFVVQMVRPSARSYAIYVLSSAAVGMVAFTTLAVFLRSDLVLYVSLGLMSFTALVTTVITTGIFVPTHDTSPRAST